MQKTEAELQRAYSIVSMLTNGYVWAGGEADPAKVLPRNLAVPLWEASKRLGMKFGRLHPTTLPNLALGSFV